MLNGTLCMAKMPLSGRPISGGYNSAMYSLMHFVAVLWNGLDRPDNMFILHACFFNHGRQEGHIKSLVASNKKLEEKFIKATELVTRYVEGCCHITAVGLQLFRAIHAVGSDSIITVYGNVLYYM